MKRFFATLLVAVMLLSIFPATSMAATQYATVVGGWLRLRSAANFNATTINSYYTGTRVKVLGASGNWYNVEAPDGQRGYMYGDYLRIGGGSGGVGDAYVTSHNGYGVRLRNGPGTGYRIIRTYAVGTPVTLLERGTNWCRISINGTVGYMMTQFLSFSGGGGGGEQILSYATIWSANGLGVRLRTGPSKSYSKIGVYSVGTTVAVLERGAVWDRIRVGSRVGWMMNEFLRYYSTNQVTGIAINNMTPSVGSVLTAHGLTPSNATVNYEWLVNGVVRGTSSSYTVSSSDLDATIQLRVTGYGSYTGTAVSAVTNKVLSNKVISSIRLSTMAPVVGDTLSATIEPNGATVVYAWRVGGMQVSNAATYTVTSADVGKTIELIVTGTGNFTGTLSSGLTAAVSTTATLMGVTIQNTTNTTVGAAPAVGDKLVAVPSPTQASASYQWYQGTLPIVGATTLNYTVTAANVGSKLHVVATGTGAYTGTATSGDTDTVIEKVAKPVINQTTLVNGTVGTEYNAQLTATGSGTLTWKLASGALPNGLTLNANGTITGTPTTAVNAASFGVTATNAGGTSDAVTFTLTIDASTPTPIEIAVSITNAPASMTPDSAIGLVANVVGTDNKAVTWSLSGSNSGSTIDENTGVLSIGADEKADSITVTATSKADNSKTATATIQINNSPAPTIEVPEVSGASSVEKGSKATYEATSNGLPAIVNWSITGATDQATTINSAGELTVASGEAASSITVKAELASDASKAGTFTVTLTDPPKAEPTTYSLNVTGGTVEPLQNRFAVGASVTVTANTADTGKRFTGWSATGIDLSGNANSSSITFNMPNGDVSLTATYEDIPKLSTPANVVWAADGRSVSWNSVDNAAGYTIWRFKVGDNTTTKETTVAEPNYTFQTPGAVGDIFYVRANGDGTNYLSSEAVSAECIASSNDSSEEAPNS